MARAGRKRKLDVERTSSGQIKKPSTARTTDQTCVYVMEARSGLIKVGSSWSPALRAESLKWREHLELAVVWFGRAADEDARALERAVHKRLKADHQHVKGEWYRGKSADIVATIQKVAEEMGITLETGEPTTRKEGGHHDYWMRRPNEREAVKIWRL